MQGSVACRLEPQCSYARIPAPPTDHSSPPVQFQDCGLDDVPPREPTGYGGQSSHASVAAQPETGSTRRRNSAGAGKTARLLTERHDVLLAHGAWRRCLAVDEVARDRFVGAR